MESTGIVMKMRLFIKSLVSYGAARLMGKAIVAFLLVSQAFAEPAKVTAFGDSLTQGYGLPIEDGFVPQMQDWLAEQGADVVLVNAGVSGDTTAGGAARIDWSLAEKPDAMIIALGGNDVLRGIDPKTSRANLEKILAAATSAGVRVLLVGLAAPDNYGSDYKDQFQAIYPDLANTYGTLLYENFFVGLGAPTQDEVRQLMQADGIHPNAEGVKRIVAAMGPMVVALIDQALQAD